MHLRSSDMISADQASVINQGGIGNSLRTQVLAIRSSYHYQPIFPSLTFQSSVLRSRYEYEDLLPFHRT